MSAILPNLLYLGGIRDASDTDWLRRRGIKCVLSVANYIDEPAFRQAVADANASHHIFEIADVSTQELSALFPELSDLIDRSLTSTPPEPVLVHCMMGVSRSATVVLAYLMEKHRMNLDEATRLVLAQRNNIFPNDGFIRQLFDLEYRLFGRYSFEPNVVGMREFKRLLQFG